MSTLKSTILNMGSSALMSGKKSFHTLFPMKSNNFPSLKTRIVASLGTNDEEVAKTKLSDMMKENFHLISQWSLIMIILAAALFMTEAFDKKPLRPSQYYFLTLTLIVLLAVGVSTPMI